jgi:DNA helicase-2/ATP-dependent DNA helicase PcrA
MAHPIVGEELQLLEQVRTALAAEPVSSRPSEESALRELAHLREQLLSGRGADDRPALLIEFNRQEALLRRMRESRQAPRVSPDSPYFGHLRVREDGREWDLCLGKATFVAGDVTVVDWRNAPISRLFYRYEQGDEFEEQLAGRTRSGTVTARRSLAIRDGRLQRIDAPEGIFRSDATAADGWERVPREAPRLAGGEGAALRIYGPGSRPSRRLGTTEAGRPLRADKHLPDIAGLIDPAQFELITAPGSGPVVIRGTAGSGKTTVALHRIAYLAFDDPSVDSDRTLVVVFSRALRDYVGHVLPALGVRRVRVVTLHDWAAEQRRRLFPRLPRETRDDAPAIVQRLQAHPVMLAALREQIAANAGPATAAQAIDDWGSALSDVERLAAIIRREAPNAFSHAELTRAADWCRRRHRALTAWLAGEDDTPVELSPADDPLLLRAWQERVGPLPDAQGRQLRLRHVAVDEVQDLSPLEVRVLLDCLDEHRSMTLAGDTQQHVLQDAGFTSWDDFFRHLGVSGTEVSTLRVSYRSTREIVDFALSVLGDLREDDVPPLTTRSGPPVELFRFTDHGACVALLAPALKRLIAAEPLASVALLTPSPSLSEVYERALLAAEVEQVARVRNQRFRFAPGIEITEIAEVKGLEFDYVVLIEASAAHYPDTPAARRLLHVGATRAIHQLWLTSVATPSPLLREAPAQR